MTDADLERRLLAAFDELSEDDRQRLLLVVAAMRAGIEIDPADLKGKSPDELRTFAERLQHQINAGGTEH